MRTVPLWAFRISVDADAPQKGWTPMRAVVMFVSALVVSVSSAGAQQAPDVPARLTTGSLVVPALPAPTIVGWGEVFLEVSVDASGAVTGIRDLRTTPPFGEMVRSAVGRWRFDPALAGEEAVGSEVLVAAIYRPMTLYNNPTTGTPPVDVAEGSAAVPHPVNWPPPIYPFNALSSAVVVVEVIVDERGAVAEALVVSPESGFDSSALETARQWRFEPARLDGAPAPSAAYLIFAFREPVTLP